MDEQNVTHIVLRQHHSSSSYSEQETAAVCHLSTSTIRHFHTLGLITGAEIDGKLRYGEDEITQLRRVRRLQRDLGVNLAGVEVILRLLKRLEVAHQELDQMRKRPQ